MAAYRTVGLIKSIFTDSTKKYIELDFDRNYFVEFDKRGKKEKYWVRESLSCSLKNFHKLINEEEPNNIFYLEQKLWQEVSLAYEKHRKVEIEFSSIHKSKNYLIKKVKVY